MKLALSCSRGLKLPPPALAATFALLLVSSGCGDEVYSDYGLSRGYTETSLNGTRVLREMFVEAGHTVRSWRYLSPTLNKADVIVWFPDDFNAPSAEVEHWLTNWLADGDANGPPRVLIYVGRDFDAAPDYWQRMQGQAPTGLKAEYARRLAEAKGRAVGNRPGKLLNDSTEDWFSLDAKPKKTKVKKLTGEWAEGIDASKIEIVRNTRLVPMDYYYTPLLGDADHQMLVSEFSDDVYDGVTSNSQLIMIENGSWLLNARLVNHEHRKLAGKLVDRIGPPARRVVFLESGDGGPPIREADPSDTTPTGLQLFRVWPIGAVLVQLAALGIVFAVMKWPIFGIPRRMLRKNTSDFGSHISALGRLLAAARDRVHAVELLQIYRQSLRRETTTTITQPNTSLPSPPTNTASE